MEYHCSDIEEEEASEHEEDDDKESISSFSLYNMDYNVDLEASDAFNNEYKIEVEAEEEEVQGQDAPNAPLQADAPVVNNGPTAAWLAMNPQDISKFETTTRDAPLVSSCLV